MSITLTALEAAEYEKNLEELTALLARHNELREAVALMLAALDSDKADAMVRYFDARAEVDLKVRNGRLNDTIY